MAGSATSPWHNTSIINNDYLDLMAIRPIPALDSDPRYVIQEKSHVQGRRNPKPLQKSLGDWLGRKALGEIEGFARRVGFCAKEYGCD